MQARYRAAAATGLVAMCTTGLSVLGAGSASAATVSPDSCFKAVTASPGDSLVVSANTILGPQLSSFSPPLAAALRPALSSLALPPITLKSGDTTIGGTVADAIVAALPSGIPSDGLAAVRTAIVNGCPGAISFTESQSTGSGANKANANSTSAAVKQSAPTQAAAPVVDPPVSSASAPASAPSLPSYGHVPKQSYADLTAVPAGGTGFSVGVAPVMPPKSLTGYGLPALPMAPGASSLLTPSGAPGFGALPAPATQSPSVQPVSGMSEVTALPAGPAAAKTVPAEAVFAALLLSLTTAALVRTWVLRRSAS